MPVGSDRSGGHEDSTEYGEGAQTASPAAPKAYEALVVASGTDTAEDPLVKQGNDDEGEHEREGSPSNDERIPQGQGPAAGVGFTPHPNEVAAPIPEPETPEAERELGLKRVWKQVGGALVVVVVAVGAFAATRGGDPEKPTSTGGAPTTPAPAGEAERFSGTSGGQIGCITCDGKHRYISIANSTTGVDQASLPVQEMAWPEDGSVTAFGVTINGENRGVYGVNLFVNGEYSVGCTMQVGMTSCQSQMDPAPLSKGDRVTIIVGEAGTITDGKVASQGDFTMSWYFDFVAS